MAYHPICITVNSEIGSTVSGNIEPFRFTKVIAIRVYVRLNVPVNLPILPLGLDIAVEVEARWAVL